MKRIELRVDAPMASPRPRFRNAGMYKRTCLLNIQTIRKC